MTISDEVRRKIHDILDENHKGLQEFTEKALMEPVIHGDYIWHRTLARQRDPSLPKSEPLEAYKARMALKA